MIHLPSVSIVFWLCEGSHCRKNTADIISAATCMDVAILLTRTPLSFKVVIHFFRSLAQRVPPGFHTTTREPKRAHLRVPAFKNTTKIQRENTGRGKNEILGGPGEGRSKPNLDTHT